MREEGWRERNPSRKYAADYTTYIYINVCAPFLMKSCKTPAPQDNYEFHNLSFYEVSSHDEANTKENICIPSYYAYILCRVAS
jgi:hypothetical protein